jgi:hypothetical protein
MDARGKLSGGIEDWCAPRCVNSSKDSNRITTLQIKEIYSDVTPLNIPPQEATAPSVRFGVVGQDDSFCLATPGLSRTYPTKVENSTFSTNSTTTFLY